MVISNVTLIVVGGSAGAGAGRERSAVGAAGTRANGVERPATSRRPSDHQRGHGRTL